MTETLWSEDAEHGVLGALMNSHDGKLFEDIQPVRAEHFRDKRNAAIFEAIYGLEMACRPYDAPSVAARLGGALEGLGGMAALQAMRQYAATWRINPKRTAAKLRELHQRRQIVSIAEGLIQLAGDQTCDTEGLIDRASRDIGSIARNRLTREPRLMAEVLMQRVAAYSEMAAGDGVAAYATGIPSLDWALSGGWRPGKVITIAARPGIGKSSLSAQFVIKQAMEGHPGLFLSQEMGVEELADRGLSNMGRVPLTNILTGKLTDDDWARAVEALESAKDAPLWIDDQGALTLSDIKNKARAIKGLKFLALDYLQLCSKSEGASASNRNSEIEEISRGMKALAMELQITVFMLSQLNRDVEKRADKRPMLADLRDSGSIEQDSDVVLLLWPVNGLGDDGKLIGMEVAKNRQGKNNVEIAMDFRGAVQRWGESDQPLRSASPAPAPRAKREQFQG